MASKHLWGSQLSYNGSVEAHPLGTVRTEYDSTDKTVKSYRFVATAGDTFVLDGNCLAWLTGGTTVTSDISDADVNLPAGVGIGQIDPTSFGWIQIAGLHSSINLLDNGVAEGQSVILTATDAKGGTIASGTAPTSKLLGVITFGSGSAAAWLTVSDVVGV